MRKANLTEKEVRHWQLEVRPAAFTEVVKVRAHGVGRAPIAPATHWVLE